MCVRWGSVNKENSWAARKYKTHCLDVNCCFSHAHSFALIHFYPTLRLTYNQLHTTRRPEDKMKPFLIGLIWILQLSSSFTFRVLPNQMIISHSKTNDFNVFANPNGDNLDEPPSNTNANSLDSLLVDAEKFRSQSSVSSPSSSTPSTSSSSSSAIIPKIKEGVSLIVTADFFLICGFLLWFLLGAGLSIAGVGDGVQIAFNGIFQPIVQPALGVLMIGSLAGAWDRDDDKIVTRFDGFKDEDEDK